MTEKPSEMPVTCVVDSRDRLGEGVFWCTAEMALYWLDVPIPSCLHRWNPLTGERRTWPMPEMITAMAKRADGTLLVASHHGLNVFDPRSGELRRVATPEADQPLNRSNDGTVDARGRFWYGTMRNNLAPDGSDLPITEAGGSLYRVDGDLRVTAMESGIGIPNASCFSPDNRTFYFADTRANTIFAYDFDLERGALSNKRVFAAPEDYGAPDGATLDAEGFVWNARWGAACVLRFAPDGSIDRVVPIPAPFVTCCAFGGRKLDTLYVTSARHAMSAAQLAEYPLGGGVFALQPGIVGLPRPAFAG